MDSIRYMLAECVDEINIVDIIMDIKASIELPIIEPTAYDTYDAEYEIDYDNYE